MSTDTELANRDAFGMNSLRDGSPHLRPPDTLHHIINCAIWGCPDQRLLLSEIRNAIRKSFAYYVAQNDGWPVSGIIDFVPESGGC